MARPRRQEEVRTERRRRDDADLNGLYGRKLVVPPEFEGDTDHHYYWANDDGARIYDLTKRDDYDVCTLREGENVHEVRIPVGQKADGKPLEAVLLRKPMWMHLEDQRKKDDGRKAQERRMEAAPHADPEQSGADAGKIYARAGNSIKSGTYTP